MSEPEIKPRVDEDTGDRLCGVGCPQGEKFDAFGVIVVRCAVDGLDRVVKPDNSNIGYLCPVHARRVAQWAERVYVCLDQDCDRPWVNKLLRDYPNADKQDGGA